MSRLLVLLVIACLAAPLALYAFYTGALPYGNPYEGAAVCTLPEALPAGAHMRGGDGIENNTPYATMKTTLLPLGIVCAVQLVNPTRTEVIMHQSWPATIAWLGFTAVTLGALVLALLQGRRLYRQREVRA